MIELLNRGLNTLSHWAMHPLRGASPWAAIVWVSFWMALSALVVVKYGSRQSSVRRARNVAIARVLEFRLFKDDIWGVFGILGRVLAALGAYVLETCKPMLIMMVPFILVMIHLAGWFEWRPLQCGESAVVTVLVKEPDTLKGVTLTLETSDGLRVQTVAFFSPEGQEAVWRFRVQNAAAPQWLVIRVGDQRIKKGVAVGGGMLNISKARMQSGIWSRLSHPAEPSLPSDGMVAVVDIDYPRRNLMLGSRRIHWVVALFVLSMAFGWVLKFPLHVEL